MNETVDADMNSGPCASDLRRAGRIDGNIDRKDTKVGIGIGSILARCEINIFATVSLLDFQQITPTSSELLSKSV